MEPFENEFDYSASSGSYFNQTECLLKFFLRSLKCVNNEIFGSFRLSNKYLNLSSDILPLFQNNLKNFLWPTREKNSLTLVRYLIQNAQYVHLNNFCNNTRWLHRTKNLRNFLLGKSALFFNDVELSIDLFLKASHNIEKDGLLMDFLNFANKRFTMAESTENFVRTSSKMASAKSNRRSIVIGKKMVRMSGDDGDDDDDDGEDEASSSSSKKLRSEKSEPMNESYLLLNYYTKIIHYFDLNGNQEAVIELIQNALLKCIFDVYSRVNFFL